MIAVLCEHTGGKWPFWLNPRQIVVLPVSAKSMEYAQTVHDAIMKAGFYVDLDQSDEQLKKKIALAQIEQYNFILVIGEVTECFFLLFYCFCFGIKCASLMRIQRGSVTNVCVRMSLPTKP